IHAIAPSEGHLEDPDVEREQAQHDPHEEIRANGRHRTEPVAIPRTHQWAMPRAHQRAPGGGPATWSRQLNRGVTPGRTPPGVPGHVRMTAAWRTDASASHRDRRNFWATSRRFCLSCSTQME